MAKKIDKISETQEIAQEEKEIRREYLIFVPVLIAVVVLLIAGASRISSRSAVELVPGVGQSGYWIVYDNGEVEGYGAVTNAETIDIAKDSKIVAAQPADKGFWAMTDSGAIYPIAGADYAGGANIVYGDGEATELVNLPNGKSYRIALKNGPIYDFNTSPVVGGESYSGSIASVVSTISGEGYWIISPEGKVTTMGDAAYFNDLAVNQDVVVDASAYGNGFIAITNKGNVYIAGDGENHGDPSEENLQSPIVDVDGIAGKGYRVTLKDATVYNYGEAQALNQIN